MGFGELILDEDVETVVEVAQVAQGQEDGDDARWEPDLRRAFAGAPQQQPQ